MKYLSIDKASFSAGLAAVTGGYRIAAPVSEGPYCNFKPLEKGQAPEMDAQNTRLSPKSAVYPQSEVMFTYTLDENKTDHHVMKDAGTDYSPRALVGIRPCDAMAFLVVKRNFDNPDYQDPYWVQAYEATTLIGHACTAPCSSCFCTSAGSGPYAEAGLDILLADSAEGYAAKVLSDKGAAFAKAAGWKTQMADDAAESLFSAGKAAAEEKIVSRVNTDLLAQKETTALYEAPFWEDVSFSCINCGTCTYLCPTCWCFDIQDENRGKEGLRMRNWDSCMFPLFTLHGAGHNPRGTKLHRVRQRFMHKLKYYVDKYEAGIQCVGCGRCIRHCPVNIDIRKVCELMNNYGADACAVSA
ncbi:MAG: 4Fe-4S dicluster domain-containing protein [Pseudomonadota bacterium]